MTSPIRRGALALALGILGFSLGSARAGITVIDRPDAAPANRHYPANRRPLLASPLVKLPVGAVRPGLAAAAIGAQGRRLLRPSRRAERLPEEGSNAWLSPKGEGRARLGRIALLAQGLRRLGLSAGRPRIIKEARRWIEAAIASQRRRRLLRPRGGASTTAQSQARQARPVAEHAHAQRPAIVLRILGDERVIRPHDPVLPLELCVPEDDFLPPLLAAAAGGRQPGERLLALQPHGRAVALGPGREDPPPHGQLDRRHRELARREHLAVLPRPGGLFPAVEGPEAPGGHRAELPRHGAASTARCPAGCTGPTRTAAPATPIRARPPRPAPWSR